jgi:zinc/manganese transport system substrate-binding protein
MTSHTTTHERHPQRHRRRLAAVTAVAFLLAACGGQAEQAEPSPSPAPAASAPVTIVATTSILGDLVANLLGDAGGVEVLMAPGVDPHSYEASLADAARLREVDLVVANGLLLEPGLLAALDAAEQDGVRVLMVAEKLDPIEFSSELHDHAHGDDVHDHGDDHAHGDEAHDHGDDHAHGDDEHGDEMHGDDAHGDDAHGELDPHFWWDPIRTARAVELIATELALIRPEVDWAARAASYNAEILAVHEEMVALFEAIPAERRSLITNHDSLGYLGDRYGFEVIGTIIPGSSVLAETNPQAFAALVELLVAEGIDVVFAENTDRTALAEALASEAIGRSDLQVQVVRIYTDALGQPGSGAETYLGMLRTTAGLIHAALVA